MGKRSLKEHETRAIAKHNGRALEYMKYLL